MTKDFRPDPSDKLYTFDDVQGIEEAKAEVQEIVEFLKFPEKFQKLGAKLPTGVCVRASVCVFDKTKCVCVIKKGIECVCVCVIVIYIQYVFSQGCS